MLGNYVQYFVMFTLSQAYDILSCDFLENAAAPASAGLRPPGGRGALGQTVYMQNKRDFYVHPIVQFVRGTLKMVKITFRSYQTA